MNISSRTEEEVSDEVENLLKEADIPHSRDRSHFIVRLCDFYNFNIFVYNMYYYVHAFENDENIQNIYLQPHTKIFENPDVIPNPVFYTETTAKEIFQKILSGKAIIEGFNDQLEGLFGVSRRKQ